MLKHNVRCSPCHCWNSNNTWGHTFQVGLWWYSWRGLCG